MSRIGKKPIPIPDGVRVQEVEGIARIEGPVGAMATRLPPGMRLLVSEGAALVVPERAGAKKAGALWGLSRSLVANAVEGVSRGFEKTLVFEGIGYRAALEGKTLVLQMGFSHPVRFSASEGIGISLEKNTIRISGYDKQAVGRTAAEIRAIRPPEPYKGKGIRYQDEIIRRKAGKKATVGG
ncbi:MAG: 50S ribosomal protein L6 [Candidatus Sungbacteria bacterium]|nr:50S ribosomal protein L6 [Candidatus Sungbacteria bacterium]